LSLALILEIQLNELLILSLQSFFVYSSKKIKSTRIT